MNFIEYKTITLTFVHALYSWEIGWQSSLYPNLVDLRKIGFFGKNSFYVRLYVNCSTTLIQSHFKFFPLLISHVKCILFPWDYLSCSLSFSLSGTS